MYIWLSDMAEAELLILLVNNNTYANCIFGCPTWLKSSSSMYLKSFIVG